MKWKRTISVNTGKNAALNNKNNVLVWDFIQEIK